MNRIPITKRDELRTQWQGRTRPTMAKKPRTWSGLAWMLTAWLTLGLLWALWNWAKGRGWL